ncbi:alcohol dehydrogenase catalytic domain-containing protein [Pseudofrankia inefficax]|uniref:Alcohol dehydrogenase GroES domain protein n=1 Tax=Pseudofrankia inefficax (strain DSM 45817 / CECT 9037 / DDB 130130 / EuI1c) TaxID=298654 RepID=E3IWH5_PSEI1|nr:alcohol dehydrogenase catalytic domain-containing protein [Pseudofrankia inefficax]ADP80158.1 Alcohol dehydrogenase GroES domain protein [Pseudofrankia inefficax]
MRAVIVESVGTVTVAPRPDPVLPGPGGAVIAVSASAICGSDLHFYDGDYPIVEPLAVGHEAIGTVVEKGPETRRFAIGDRVLVSAVAGCGACDGCATQNPVLCHDGPQIFGSGSLGGGQADLLAVPAADFQLTHLPEDMDVETALLLTDNLPTAWAGALRADIQPGATVAVIGLGAVGLCAVRCAIALGAGTVLAIDPVAGRREHAVKAGAIGVAPPAVNAVLEATNGRGVAAVIDAVATNASLGDAMLMVRPEGTVSVIGAHDLKPFPFPALMALTRSITLRSTFAPPQRTWSALIPLLRSGRLDVSDIFTHQFPLERASDAYAAIATRSADCVKVQLVP